MSTVNQSPENRTTILGSVIFQKKQQNIAKCVNYGASVILAVVKNP